MKSNYLKSIFSVTIACFGTALLSGCQTTPSNNNQNPVMTDKLLTAELVKYKWSLTSAVNANKQPIAQIIEVPKPATLNFHKRGHAVSYRFDIGCNNFGAPIKILNNSITPEMLMATKMFCESLDKTERKFAQFMGGTSKLTISTSKSNDSSSSLRQITANGSMLTWKGTQGNH